MYHTVLQFLCLLTVLVTVNSRVHNIGENNKIVGGHEVEPNSIPYQILLERFGNSYCGAVLYNNKTVITTESCCTAEEVYNIVVIAGAHDVDQITGKTQKTYAASIKIHPEYLDFSNDLCLIEVKEPFQFNEYVSSVAIAHVDQEFEGDAIVSGWGNAHNNGMHSKVLKAVKVPLVSHEDCNKAYVGFEIDDSMLCAGIEDKGFCQGDHGSPLTCEGILCGLSSFSWWCGEPEYPGVYTRISKFSQWIKENSF